MKLNFFIVIFFVITLLSTCTSVRQDASAISPGPKTEAVILSKYQEIYYVSAANGSDQNGDGSKEKPWQSVHVAFSQINGAESAKRFAILVSEGNYGGETLVTKEFVDLYGGFEPTGWQRDIFKFRTILNGTENQRIMVGANHSRLDGFVITKARFRGKGAAIWCNNVSPTITNNVFTKNKTLAPDPWSPKFRHEIANDGGAIYCENGAAPIIEHNLFAENETEAGRGAAIAFHKNCNGRISGNIFLNNRTGLNDPMRSSDGGAVSIFDWSNPLVENNIFLNNKAFAANDAGAMFVALWSSPVISKNLFVGNECTDDAGALFVGGQEHRYDRPLDPLPGAEKFFVRMDSNVFIGNSNPSKNSGAMRFTMESRGHFKNNIVAHNSGIYFQRCEVNIENNVILDDFQLIETKEGLQASAIKNNILWGGFHLGIAATVSGNNMKEKMEGNTTSTPNFINDWMEIKAEAASYNPKTFVTSIVTSGANLKTNELVNRIVRTHDQWGVVNSNDCNSIEIWGDFAGSVNFTVLPTYRLK